MPRRNTTFVLLAFLGLGVRDPTCIRAQELAANPTSETKPKLGLASLKISLRLQDGSPFLGAVTVRLMPDEGYEKVGAHDDTPGDFLFPDVEPGKYIVEVAAPGYLEARLKSQVDTGHRQKTMIVLMKPRPVPKVSETRGESTAVASAGVTTKDAGSNPSSGTSPPVVPVNRNFWKFHELEDNVPRVDASVPCPMQDILYGVGQRMTEFVATLEKFTATEHLEHYTVDGLGERKGPEKRKFEYVVAVTQMQNGKFIIDEFRDGGTGVEQFPAHIATQGLPALALIFHPTLAGDFDFRCEGLGQWGGQELWQLHFAQRADRPVQIRSYYIAGHLYPIYLEGRVWIDPGSNQVVRMESELAKLVPEIELKSELIMIEYRSVTFLSTGQQIWLPYKAEVYVERQQRRYYRQHTFSDFRLFNVETSQTVRAPMGSYSFTNISDSDVSGELTVTSEPETNLKPVTLRFTVPAHTKLFKVVGPGKDVNLPPASVASATFAHSGKDGWVKVEVFLVKETMLDVIAETPISGNSN
jgi:hypothetical protein